MSWPWYLLRATACCARSRSKPSHADAPRTYNGGGGGGALMSLLTPYARTHARRRTACRYKRAAQRPRWRCNELPYCARNAFSAADRSPPSRAGPGPAVTPSADKVIIVAAVRPTSPKESAAAAARLTCIREEKKKKKHPPCNHTPRLQNYRRIII